MGTTLNEVLYFNQIENIFNNNLFKNTKYTTIVQHQLQSKKSKQPKFLNDKVAIHDTCNPCQISPFLQK